MESVTAVLSSSKPLLLFTVIGLGYLAGHIRFRGVTLGVAAVLFVGLIIGSLAPGRLTLPPEIGDIGLIIFIYMVGLQSGPGFFASFARRGLALNAVAAAAVVSAAITVTLCGKVLGLPGPLTAGLFAGSMTNTPALAAAVENVQSLAEAGRLPAEAGALPIIGYSIAYPFAVIGTILSLHIFSRLFKIEFRKEIQDIRIEDKLDAATLHSKDYLITNAQIQKKGVTARSIHERTGVALSRFRRGHEVMTVSDDTVFRKGDVVVAVGTNDQLEAAGLILGEESKEHLEHHRNQIDYRRVFVSNPEVAGKRIGELPLNRMFGATITRLRRGDVEFATGPETFLEIGDRVRVVASANKMEAVSRYLGDSVKKVSEAEILSPAFGMVLGVLIGMISIPLPTGTPIKLGFAGGPLVVSLILGKLGKTGPIHWNIPQPVNHSLRQFGLLLFLATIGLRAGERFLSHFGWDTLWLFIAGVLVTLVPVVVAVLLARFLQRMQMVRITGAVAGIQTQPAVLAAAQDMTGSDLPSVSYATVYPLVMILKIIAVQIMILFG